MNSITKKAVLLLKSLIFHYHGLDKDERILLEQAAKRLDAENEMLWANEFIAEDYLSAFERSRRFLLEVFPKMTPQERLKYLLESWEENLQKGYITEMETNAILTLSKDWEVDKEFLIEMRN